MAEDQAPTLSVGQMGNTLRLKKKQQIAKSQAKASGRQGKRVTKKNILLSPYKAIWPVIDDETEETVLNLLTAKLECFPRLCPEQQKGPKMSVADDDGEIDSTDDDLVRRRLRSQLAIGHRQVSKHLERNRLALALVWGEAQPSLITDSLLPLVATRSCPALRLRNLMPRIMAATGLTSLVALGFKKVLPGLDDFSDFISAASKLAPPVNLPWAAKEDNVADKNSDSDGSGDDDEPKQDGDSQDEVRHSQEDVPKVPELDDCKAPNSQLVINWPLALESDEQQILGKLTGLLTPYKDILKTRRKKFQTAEWKKKRNTLRTQILTDPAAVRDAAKTRKVVMLLIQKDKPANPLVNSAAVFAVEHDIPVLCLSCLRQVMSPVLRNPLLAVVAFRKCEEDKQVVEFKDFVTFISQFASKELKNLLPVKETVTTEEASGKSETKPVKKPSPKPPVPVYNVSHLYVYKTETAKPERTARQSADFISFSSAERESETSKGTVALKEPTPSYISLSSVPDIKLIGQRDNEAGGHPACELTPAAFVDTKGECRASQEQTAHAHRRKSQPAEAGDGSVSFGGILGMDVADSPSASSLPDPERAKRKARAALKRKLESGAASGDFVSFKFSPTTVQASTSNPNKNKRGKKKKK